jgi:glycosyltransferase involved in cell wall biosynthesis
MISVVIPVYNEAGSVARVIDDLHVAMHAVSEPYEIIVVDDGSTDGSAAALRLRSDVTLLQHSVNRGYGRALKTAIAHAKGDWIAICDADATYPVSALGSLLEARKDNDMVVGSRGQTRNISLPRRVGQWILKRLVWMLVQVNVPDLNSGFRVFRRDLAEEFWGLLPDGFSFTTTITVSALCAGRGVAYVSIDYHKRVGKSSINPVKDFHNFMLLIIMTATYFRPLKFYAPVAYVLFGLAILRAIRDIVVLDRLAGLSVVLVTLAVQVWFFGLLADIVVKRSERRHHRDDAGRPAGRG